MYDRGEPRFIGRIRLLDDLAQSIETLQERIKAHGKSIGDYESRTRVTLIDPMLCALGWEVSDPSRVQIEPRTANGWADYALLGSNGRPVVFIEAKALSVTRPPVLQTVSYAVAENTESAVKVAYCAWTNGDEWAVFDVFRQDAVTRVSLAREDPAKCALKLLCLWRRSLMDGSMDMPVEPVIDLEPPPIITPSSTLPMVISPTDTQWLPLTAKFSSKGSPPPKAIRMPDGAEKTLKSWRGVLLETALWLHGRGLLTRENCRIHRGPVRLLFSPDGKHSTGTPFHSPVRVGDTGIQMEGSFEPHQFVSNTHILLVHFGQNPSDVHLKMA